MSQEYLKELVAMERMLNFLKDNYATNEVDIDLVIQESEKHKTQHLSAVSYLVTRVHSVAENLGIVKDNEFPLNHLPTMLEAVKELETDIPSENKQITNKRSIELLITGELTVARSVATRLRGYKGVMEHAERVVQLMNFRNKLG